MRWFQIPRRLTAVLPVAAAAIGVSLVAWTWADCPSVDHGCAVSDNVPCSNATCVAVGQWPYGPPAPFCDNGQGGNAAAFYSATATSAWYICMSVSNPNYGQCDESPTTCANVWVFSAAGCALANRCQITTVQKCSGGGQKPCSS